MEMIQTVKDLLEHRTAQPVKETTTAESQQPRGVTMDVTLKTVLSDLETVLGFLTDGKTEAEKSTELATFAEDLAQGLVAGILARYSAAAGTIEELIYQALETPLRKMVTGWVSEALTTLHI